LEFEIGGVEKLRITDQEISGLLSLVYVEAGFTLAKVAEEIFEPNAVRDRGIVIGARERTSNEFAGMVILVPPTSKAIVRAKENECEIQLLGVKPRFRGHGLGRELVTEAIKLSQSNNWLKIILWTQKPMKSAQYLYESFNFLKKGEMVKNGVEFFVYERVNT